MAPTSVVFTCKIKELQEAVQIIMALSHKWLPYDMAVEYMKRVKSTLPNYPWSRKLYKEWHAIAKPPIPRYPNRIYKEWTSWNDFLTNNNIFKGNLEQIEYRPYWEAVRWSQDFCKANNISTQREWGLCWRHDKHLIPKDIPGFPESKYEEFYENGGYKTWTGKDLQHIMKSEKQNIALMALCNTRNVANNIIEVVIAKDGYSHLQDIIRDRGNIFIMECYQYEPELAENIHNILNNYAFDKGGNTYTVPNMNELLFELSSLLLLFRPNS